MPDPDARPAAAQARADIERWDFDKSAWAAVGTVGMEKLIALLTPVYEMAQAHRGPVVRGQGTEAEAERGLSRAACGHLQALQLPEDAGCSSCNLIAKLAGAEQMVENLRAVETRHLQYIQERDRKLAIVGGLQAERDAYRQRADEGWAEASNRAAEKERADKLEAELAEVNAFRAAPLATIRRLVGDDEMDDEALVGDVCAILLTRHETARHLRETRAALAQEREKLDDAYERLALTATMLREAREALRRYGRHNSPCIYAVCIHKALGTPERCTATHHNHNAECTCGLAAALTAIGSSGS